MIFFCSVLCGGFTLWSRNEMRQGEGFPFYYTSLCIFILQPSGEKQEILISLSYLPSAERLTVVLLKARNLHPPPNKDTIGKLLRFMAYTYLIYMHRYTIHTTEQTKFTLHFTISKKTYKTTFFMSWIFKLCHMKCMLCHFCYKGESNSWVKLKVVDFIMCLVRSFCKSVFTWWWEKTTEKEDDCKEKLK